MSGLEPGTMARALSDLAAAIEHLGRTVSRAGVLRRTVAVMAHAKIVRAFNDLAEHVNAVPGWMAGKEATERNLREQIGVATATLLDDASAQLDDGARVPAVRAWRIVAGGGWILVVLFVAREFTR